MKEIFRPEPQQPNRQDSKKPFKHGSIAFIRLLDAQIYLSSRLAQMIDVKIGDSLELAYDRETDTVYVSKTDLPTGYKLRPHNNNPDSKSGTIYVRDFLKHFNLEIKKNYRIDIEHIDKEKKEFRFEYRNGIDSIRSKKPAFFMKLSAQNRLYLSKSLIKAMELKVNDIISIFYDKSKKIGYIRKNAREDINGFVVKGSGKEGKEYISSKLMQSAWGWPTVAKRLTLKRGDNKFYFELSIKEKQ